MIETRQDKKIKVFVGLSGGVDSSVATYLLREQGYDVTGVFIKVWHPDFLVCDWRAEMRDAMRVCAKLEIPFKLLDLEEVYKKEVIDYMLAEYAIGRTPNPDVMCNKSVKFGAFLDYAIKEGADFVATGHYAQNIKDENNLYHLKESVDSAKDQSYFLWTLNQKQLSKILFPIGHLNKSEVRKIAEKAELHTCIKKDSQGLCFIGHINLQDFLKKYIKTQKGKVLNTKGEEIGEHEGAILYTLGQRHGFTLNKQTNSEEIKYVVAKNIENNTITVSSNLEKPKEEQICKIKDINLITQKLDNQNLQARIRYHGELYDIKVDLEKSIVNFDSKDAILTTGQSLVFYKNKECLGGGVIDLI
jgi:tRNA-specific 2-thiouridylase